MNQDDWSDRITRHIQPDGSVTVPPRIAAWLESQAGLTADRRINLRTTDPEAYVALAALHLAALRSETGTEHSAGQRNTTPSEMWLSTNEAANALNVTDRCIRKWCTTGRLRAQLVGGRWLINPNSIALHDIA